MGRKHILSDRISGCILFALVLQSSFGMRLAIREKVSKKFSVDDARPKIAQSKAKVDSAKVEELLAELDQLVGLTDVKAQMRNLMNQVEFNMERVDQGLPEIADQSLHMTFYGNPGTGKTVVARIVGELLVAMGAIKPPKGAKKKDGKEVVTEVSRADLVGQYTGSTAPKVKKAVENALGGVLFIDEAYALVSEGKDPFGIEAVDTLIKLMEDNREHLVVIFAGYDKEMQKFLQTNPGLKSRINFNFVFQDYLCHELVQIADLQLAKNGMSAWADADNKGGCTDDLLVYSRSGDTWVKAKKVKSDAEYIEVKYADGRRKAVAIKDEGQTWKKAPKPLYCKWLHAGLEFTTGCCVNAGECDTESNRGNGNGRSVRNMLEKSFRGMAQRVLNTYTFPMLESFDKEKKPEVVGSGKDAKPEPAVDCGSAFQATRLKGPFNTVEEVGDADVRCAFMLLETQDMQGAVRDSLLSALGANCQYENKAMKIKVDDFSEEGVYSGLDWPSLHKAVMLDKKCDEPQQTLREMIDAFSLKGGGLLQKHAVMNTTAIYRCDPPRCKTRTDCGMRQSSCKDCTICKASAREVAGIGNRWVHNYEPVRKPPASRRPQASRRYAQDDTNLKCDACQFAFNKTKRMEITELIHVRNETTCREFFTQNPKYDRYARGQKEACELAVMQVTTKMYSLDDKSRFKCSDTITGVKSCPGEERLPGKIKNFDDLLRSDFRVDNPEVRPPVVRTGSEVQELMDKLEAMIGLGNVKSGMANMRDSVEFDKWRKHFFGETSSLMGQSFHMQFLGNPGTGKTEIARLVGQLLVVLGVVKKPSVEGFKVGGKCRVKSVGLGKWFDAKILKINDDKNTIQVEYVQGENKGLKKELDQDSSFLKKIEKTSSNDDSEELIFKEVSRADLVAGYVGQTAPKVKKAVESAFGGVLFIDEAYSLVQDEKDSFGREAVDTLIKEMEDHRDKVIIIFAGYVDQMTDFFKSNPGFASRVTMRFDFEDYTCENLAAIAEKMLESKSLSFSGDAKNWFSSVNSLVTGCCTEESKADGSCAGSPKDNGNGRTVRNILESAQRSMSVRSVVTATQKHGVSLHTVPRWDGKGKSLCDKPSSSDAPICELVTKMEPVDIAAAGAELVKTALRTTCKEASEAVPELEKLLTPGRVLALGEDGFNAALESAQQEGGCKPTEAMLKKVTVVADVSGSGVPITDPEAKKAFAELDEMIGLQSVKRAMRELLAFVLFGKLREKVHMSALSGQSFHMRFLGNPGTGKTVIGRKVGDLLSKLGIIQKPADSKNADRAFVEVSRGDLVAEYVGQTANKTIEAVKSSLGGVLFIDEAYSLCTDERDKFGHEAVDTLIKEMEDKRKNVIVILAGYEAQMDTFFDSNPGFKSRVPFSFHFEDYTCPQLFDIGKLGIRKKELKLPSDESTFETSVRFATSCCDKLEECEESADKTNGRGARSALEAGIRAMASRFIANKDKGGKPPSREAYVQMEVSDFAEVAKQFVKDQLEGPCAEKGELSRYVKSFGSNSKLEKRVGELEGVLRRLRFISGQTQQVTKFFSSDRGSRKRAESCLAKLKDIKQTSLSRIGKELTDESKIDQYAALLRNPEVSEDGEIDMRGIVAATNIAMEDQEYLSEVLSTMADFFDEDKAAIKDVIEKSRVKLDSMRSSKFQLPFQALINI